MVATIGEKQVGTIKIVPISGAPSENNTLYIDSADSYALKLKNNAGDTSEVGAGGGGGTDNDLDSSPDSDLTANGLTSDMVAGESLVYGNLCYRKSDSKLWKADASAAATMPGLYLALGTISTDATGPFFLLGFARDDSWSWTVGGMIYASGTAGALTQTAPSTSGDQIQYVGIAFTATVIDFKPMLIFDEVA